MTIGLITARSGKTLSLRAETRFAITYIILVMVISSPIFMLVNSTQVSAATITDKSNSIDTSNYHSDPQATQASVPPTSSITVAAPPHQK